MDDFHAVQQWRGDGFQGIGRGDKENLREIIGNFKIIITEFDILLRVKYFQESRGRVPMEIHCQFIHFIQHENRVMRFNTPKGL